MKKFYQLITKDIFNCLTPGDQAELNAICQQKGISKEAYEKIKLHICSEETHQEISAARKPKRYLKNFIRYAAILVLPLSIASYLLIQNHTSPSPKIPIASKAILTEKPHPKQIQLILDDGKTIQLDREEKEVFVAPRILNTGKMLEYQKDTTLVASPAPSYNTVIVPAAGEFNIRLADGTQIWLNEKTELKYPVEFRKDNREIHLLGGEIYLEVAKDSLRPFIVHTPNGNVEVLGTHFNVRCINSQCTETTLAEGKVKVSQASAEVILQPGQQATVTDQISVSEADIEEVTCWKDNLFYFKDTGLEIILNKLSGWYDFEIKWQNPEFKTKKFFMSIDRYSSAQEIFNKLSEVSEVRFYINGKVVNVSK